MTKIIKLTESDLEMIVKKVIKEQTGPGITSFGSINSPSPKKIKKKYKTLVRGFFYTSNLT